MEGFRRYLGIQADFGGSKKRVFEAVRNKLDERINGWAEQFLSMAGKEERFLRWVVCGLWRIWKCGNRVVFDKIAVDPREAVELFRQHWSDIELAAGEGGQKACRHDLQVRGVGGSWSKPPFGMIKVNCDGAWCSRTGNGGFGWVARDFAGIFKVARGVGSVPCQSSLMAEAEAMREALLACVERGFEMVQVESDSKNLVDILNGALQNETIIDGIVWDILQLKQQLYSVKFLFTSRAYNGAAH
ncbi:uncharacterized protein [Malus domestica]|uniref:uncharacterized protein n=1 Tax=Malus domestica TaxID=3750 RepID=UPI003975DC11